MIQILLKYGILHNDNFYLNYSKYILILILLYFYFNQPQRTFNWLWVSLISLDTLGWFTFVQRERQNQQKWRFLIEVLGKKFKCMTSTWQDNAIGDSMIAVFNEVQDLSTSFTSLMSLSSLLVVCSACRICEQKNLKCWRCRWVCECGLQSHPHSSSWATQDKQE